MVCRRDDRCCTRKHRLRNYTQAWPSPSKRLPSLLRAMGVFRPVSTKLFVFCLVHGDVSRQVEPHIKNLLHLSDCRDAAPLFARRVDYAGDLQRIAPALKGIRDLSLLPVSFGDMSFQRRVVFDRSPLTR